MIHYAPKLTFGPETADWQERLNPERMRRRRVERAQMIMKPTKKGASAAIS